MALFYGQSCPLCGIDMHDTDRLFATSHFLGPDSDLWEYSDAVMHWDCYATWEHRSRFGRLYFDAERVSSGQNPYWGVAFVDDRLLVTTNPDKFVAQISITLAETGSGFRVALADWADWLGGEWVEACHHAIEHDALATVIPLLQTKFPTAESVVAAAGMQIVAKSEIGVADDLVTRLSYELACQKLAERVAVKGVACPGCGNFSTHYTYVRVEQISETGPLSYLMCHNCNRIFGPTDL